MRKTLKQTQKMVVSANTQADTAKKGLEFSRQSLIASQRSWLVPKTMQVVFNDDTSGAIVFIMSNVGKVPARNIKGSLRFTEDKKMFNETLQTPTNVARYALIAPGIDVEIKFGFSPLPPEKRERIVVLKSGRAPNARVYGTIFYSDDYVTDWPLPICAKYDPKDPRYDACTD